ncbi:hypothetical protein JXA12_02855 [Candidatus Woesearchaeota archaeon]|nr:hypothetical protein [Candidatus Woesearchaeota archaeon]
MEVVKLYSCVECGEVITNPISEQRLALEFRAWLAEMDGALEERFSEEYVSRADFIDEECVGQECILTKRKMDVCPYCVAAQLIDWLHSATFDPVVLDAALDFFVARQDEPYVLQRLRAKGCGVRIMLTRTQRLMA